MDRKTITPKNHEHWLELRKQDITSTAVAALFGLSPYLTHFELWHQVRGNYESDFNENERVKWGNRLEPAIAEGIAEDQGWVVRPFKDYMRIPSLKIGSSFDYLIDMPEKPKAILEIKNVDSLVFKDKWVIENGVVFEAPAHIELQAQVQTLVSGIDDAYIGALVGGNNVQLLKRQSVTEIHGEIIKRVSDFWESIEKGIEPNPNFEQDADFISKLYGYTEPGSIIEADEDIVRACHAYKEASDLEKKAKKAKNAAKAEILTMMKSAEKVQGAVKVSTWLVPEVEINTVREPYRGFRVTIPKEKK